MSYVIVFGNEKGGSGKTTTAMHTIVSLLSMGFSVASVDIDMRQQSLSRYIENRRQTLQKFPEGKLLMPDHFVISPQGKSEEGMMKEVEDLIKEKLQGHYDIILVDTPGHNSKLSSMVHSYADLVVTPINDSFIDLDLIGKISSENLDMVAPGIYSAMFFEQKIKKAALEKKEIDWVIVRNRLSKLDLINKRSVSAALKKLAKKLGFRIVPGLGDRVVFKSLFLEGLTLLDVNSTKKIRMTSSVIAARQELRDFIHELGLKDKFKGRKESGSEDR